MNKDKLLGLIREHGDSQEALANYLGITRNTLYRKINEVDGSSFDEREMSAIAKRYNLDESVFLNVFFYDLYVS